MKRYCRLTSWNWDRPNSLAGCVYSIVDISQESIFSYSSPETLRRIDVYVFIQLFWSCCLSFAFSSRFIVFFCEIDSGFAIIDMVECLNENHIIVNNPLEEMFVFVKFFEISDFNSFLPIVIGSEEFEEGEFLKPDV